MNKLFLLIKILVLINGKMERHFDKKALYYAARVLLNPKASLTEDEEEVVISALEDDLGVETEIDWSDSVLSDMLINMHMKEKGINPMNKRTHMRFIVDSYEKQQQQPEKRVVAAPAKKRPEGPRQSASDNIVCEKIRGAGGFFQVYLDPFLTGGVSVSSGLFGELFHASEEPILKLQTQTHICFARPTLNDDDDRQRIGLSGILYEVLEKPLMIKEISVCHGFPLIGRIVVSGEGVGQIDLEEISAQVTALEVLFIGLPLFGKRIFISKLYNAFDDSEMDVGKIPFGETEIPIEIENATANGGGVSINRRMPQRFQNRREINWF